MFIIKSIKFKKAVYTIQPGEYYVSDKDEVISTLLGSCVAVCLYDPVNQISGMNHFMLPGKISKPDAIEDKATKYGIAAIDKLISKMIKNGADKENLQAKIFGGGRIIKDAVDTFTIPFDNIRLAKILIEMEDIPIIKIDTGDDYTRKIYMEVKSGKIYLKKTNRTAVSKRIVLKEKEIAVKHTDNEQ